MRLKQVTHTEHVDSTDLLDLQCFFDRAEHHQLSRQHRVVGKT